MSDSRTTNHDVSLFLCIAVGLALFFYLKSYDRRTESHEKLAAAIHEASFLYRYGPATQRSDSETSR